MNPQAVVDLPLRCIELSFFLLLCWGRIMKTYSLLNLSVLVAMCATLLTVKSELALAVDATPPIPAGAYTLDKSHSTVIFRVSHIGFSFYTASFSRFDAKLDFDPGDFAASKLSTIIDVTSLQLPTPPVGFRDTLLGPDWFNAGMYPTMTYTSTTIEKTGDATARVTGNLTLKGVTHPVIIEVRFNGGYPGIAGIDPQARVGFSARGILKRSQFDLVKGLPPEGTNFGVGDDVEFIIETEFSGPPLPASAN
jgi:polyisoprenoid-binding protein YceI